VERFDPEENSWTMMPSMTKVRNIFLLRYTSVADPDPASLIRIRIRVGNTDSDPGGSKLPTKVKKIQVLKCQMFSFEG
jgi:hypothetical protein